jgi:predicted deacylase
MKKKALYKLESPYREPMVIYGFEFGDEDGEHSCAIVGSTRGDEIQQDFICASLVKRLMNVEEAGAIAPGKKILVIPCVNPYSMNIAKRFWSMDNTDINRMFPGYDQGETTQRVADGLFKAVSDYKYGIQLCSFNLHGNFEAHVRVTHESHISQESLSIADAFGLPYVVSREPTSFDTAMLNYNWQVWDTHAFSVYSQATDTLDPKSARLVRESILRFLHSRQLITENIPGGSISTYIDERQLVQVRTERAAGFLMRRVQPGDRVEKGDTLATIVDTLDTHVKETLTAPCPGYVFFERVQPMVQQDMICFMLVPTQD